LTFLFIRWDHNVFLIDTKTDMCYGLFSVDDHSCSAWVQSVLYFNIEPTDSPPNSVL